MADQKQKKNDRKWGELKNVLHRTEMTKRFWVLESLGLGFKIPMEDEREREREQ